MEHSATCSKYTPITVSYQFCVSHAREFPRFQDRSEAHVHTFLESHLGQLSATFDRVAMNLGEPLRTLA